jgi:hypothetical protein
MERGLPWSAAPAHAAHECPLRRFHHPSEYSFMSKSFLFLFVAAAAISACSDGASSRQIMGPGPVSLSGGTTSGGGGGGGGGLDS